MATLCEKRRGRRSDYAKSSFAFGTGRDTEHGRERDFLACPKGQWDPSGKRCYVPRVVWRTLLFTERTRCPRGYRKRR